MGKRAVGFYWTLTVPWAGFTALPDKIEDVAKVSRTIRYQMELIRSYASENKLTLIREEAFLEVEPDRGTQYVLGILKKLETYCREHDAILLYVDFSEAQGWRSHAPMAAWSRRAGIEAVGILPEAKHIYGKLFDPQKHFSEWRERQDDWSARKDERVSAALQRARALRSDKMTYDGIARSLDHEGLRSATGKNWSADSVRKLLR
jgi:hypothetical protein